MNDRRKLAVRMRAESRRMEHDGFDHKTPKRMSGDPTEGDGAIPQKETASELDIAVDMMMHPTIEQQLNSPGSSLTGYSIIEELMSDRIHEKVAPFVPGPIGAIPRGYTRSLAPQRKKIEKAGRISVTEAIVITGTHRQRALVALRHKNDLSLARLLREKEVKQ